jgi:hypothetical protein
MAEQKAESRVDRMADRWAERREQTMAEQKEVM